MESALSVSGVSKKFGGLAAISHLTFDAHPGVTGIIGPNGAGKSTIFNLITGFVTPDEGAISLAGQDITGHAPHRIASAGVRRTFQNIRLFSEQTALDNVAVGALRAGNKQTLRSARAAASRTLDSMGLTELGKYRPSELPYAAQRRIEIARCLVADPKVILLDEPAAGMHATERADLVDVITSLGARGVTVVLVEHDVGLVSKVADRIIVMDHGQQIAAGTPAEVRQDPEVIRAYLGTAEDD